MSVALALYLSTIIVFLIFYILCYYDVSISATKSIKKTIKEIKDFRKDNTGIQWSNVSVSFWAGLLVSFAYAVVVSGLLYFVALFTYNSVIIEEATIEKNIYSLIGSYDDFVLGINDGDYYLLKESDDGLGLHFVDGSTKIITGAEKPTYSYSIKTTSTPKWLVKGSFFHKTDIWNETINLPEQYRILTYSP